ncbi:eCIS core domain-containing protein [Streptomyces mayteni]
MSSSARDTQPRSDQRRKKRRTPTAHVPEPRQIVSGAGQPLDPGVRRELEQRLGHDLSRVRLHTDRDAAALAELLGADAVTVGEDVFFADGAYRPETADGRRLLAHELLHTVQAPHALGTLRAGRDLGAVSLPHEPMEREAEAGAHSADAVTASPHATPGWLRYATVDADRNRTERLDPATLVDRLTAGIIRSLRGDPTDASGRVRLQLARFSPEVEESVLGRLEQRLPSSELEHLITLVEDVRESSPSARGSSEAPEPIPSFIEQWHRDRARERAWESQQDLEFDRERERAAERGDSQAEEPPTDAGQSTRAPAGSTAAASAPSAAGRTPVASGPGAGREAGLEEEAPQEEAAEEQSDEQSEEERTREEEEEQAREEEEAREEKEKDKNEEQADEDGEPTEPEPSDAFEADATGTSEISATSAPDVGSLTVRGAEAEPEPAPQPVVQETSEPAEDQAAAEPPSAWDIELQPDDFLPTSDLDVSGVPTADQLDVGATTQPSTPTFPDPPPTRAEQVQAQRDSEDQDDAAPVTSPESGTTAEPENTPSPAPSDDLQTERSVEQEVGPGPATPAPTPQSGSQPSSTPTPTTPPAPTPMPEPASAPSEPAAEVPAPAPEPAPRPVREPAPASTPVLERDPMPTPASAGPEEPSTPQPMAEPAAAPPQVAAPAPAARAMPAGAPRGGGRGGGGQAVPPAKRERPAPDVSQATPESGLSTAAGLKPHQALATLNGVDASAERDVGQERAAAQDAPPTMERPSGAPQTLQGDPVAAPPGEYTEDDVTEVEGPEAQQANVDGPDAPNPEDVPGADIELSTTDMIIAGGASMVSGLVNWGSNQLGMGDVIDTDAFIQKLLDLPTEDEILAEAQLGNAPGVELKGETEGLTGEQSAEFDTRGSQLHTEGQADSQRPMGEDQIFPDVPSETMTGSVPGTRGDSEGGRGSGSGEPAGEVPAEALSEVAEHERGAEIQAAFSEGQQGIAAGRETKEQDLTAAREQHEAEVQTQIEASTRVQTEERERANADVIGAREQWRQEQDDELEEIETEKGETLTTVRQEVKAEEEDTDTRVETRRKTDDEQITTAHDTAVATAETEHRRVENESDSWLDRAVDEIVNIFNRIKNAIIGAFREARDAVGQLIESFRTKVAEWINEAREAIVGLFNDFVEAVVGFAERLLNGLLEIANRIRQEIEALIRTAIEFVNRIADELGTMISGLLDAIGERIGGILDTLKRGLLAAVNVVKNALNAVMNFALGLLGALGEWLPVAVDILSNPGGWLSSAGSAAETGAREHLFTETQAAVKEWFNQKIQEVLGLDQETFDLLINGGMTKEEIVEEAWAAVVPQLPLIIGELVITKIVAKLIPGAGWVLAIVDAIRTAWEALSEILRALGLVLDFLKAVKSGRGALPFARAVAAGVVALLELVYQALMSGIGKYVGRVADRLKGVARTLRNRRPDRDRRDEREADQTQQQLRETTERLTAPPPTRPTAGRPTASSRPPTTPRRPVPTRPGPAHPPASRRPEPARSDESRRSEAQPANRRTEAEPSSPRRAPERPRSTPRRPRVSPEGQEHRRDRAAVRAALDRVRRQNRRRDERDRIPRDNTQPRRSQSQDRDRPRDNERRRQRDNDARRVRDAYRNRRDQLRDHQRTREQRRREQREERRERENSPESKDARLRSIVARLRPRLTRILRWGVPRPVLRGLLLGMRRWYRLSGLSVDGRDTFDIEAWLNPRDLVLEGLNVTIPQRELLLFLRQLALDLERDPAVIAARNSGIVSETRPRRSPRTIERDPLPLPARTGVARDQDALPEGKKDVWVTPYGEVRRRQTGEAAAHKVVEGGGSYRDSEKGPGIASEIDSRERWVLFTEFLDDFFKGGGTDFLAEGVEEGELAALLKAAFVFGQQESERDPIALVTNLLVVERMKRAVEVDMYEGIESDSNAMRSRDYSEIFLSTPAAFSGSEQAGMVLEESLSSGRTLEELDADRLERRRRELGYLNRGENPAEKEDGLANTKKESDDWFNNRRKRLKDAGTLADRHVGVIDDWMRDFGIVDRVRQMLPPEGVDSSEDRARVIKDRVFAEIRTYVRSAYLSSLS